ncbi:MAG: FecR protein [Sphingobacteriales bacterium]|nr:FecR protein [Sphingobacteriales bacterium]
MEKEQFLQFLDIYISGKASLEEEQQLLNFYDSFEKSTDLNQQPEIEQVGEKMLNHLMETVCKDETFKQVSQQYQWKKAAIAAVVLITTMAGFYFHSRKEQPDSEQFTEINIKNDIAPEYNNAILRLADGSRISLNDATKGLIASQGNIAITKTATGQIVYEQSKTHKINTDAPSAINIIENPKGGKCQIVLPDGSRVWLNSASTLSFPITFAKTERKVTLTGEAYFEIAHNKKVPFRVESDNQIVEVLGTHFNIKSYKDEAYTKTTLLQGSVRIILRSPQLKTPKTQLLKPGEQSLTNSSQPEIKIESTDTAKVNAWKNGHFSFNNTPLQDIMKEIARWYDMDLIYEGKVPADEFTGYISNEVKISKLLKILEQSENVKFAIKGRTLKITSTQ